MSRLLRDETVTRSVVDYVVCDKCNRTVSVKDDYMEYQEMACLVFRGGYGSRQLGDDATAEIDLCQDCVYELLSPYWRVASCQHDESI